ncbi:MAG: PAS domain S-box protein, partial [Gemmatimonadaceae bacterium]
MTPHESGHVSRDIDVSRHDDPRKRLAETIERAPVGIAHFDVTGRFLFVNPALCDLFGMPREQLLQHSFQEISFPDDLPACLAMTARLAAGAIPKYTIEKRFLRLDGGFVYARVIVTVVRDAAGGISYFLGIAEDLSEQWAAEQARRAAEERLQVALEASGIGIYRFDFRTQSLDWANGLAAVFGFPADESLQSLDRLLGAIHRDDLPRVLAAYEQSAKHGADFDEEFRIVLPDGSVRWISDRARMSLDEAGAPRYLTGACADVTALREAVSDRLAMLEREQAARAEAERAIRLRDDVMAIVAHDLRNPVHTIMMGAGAMAELPLSEQDRRRQLEVIRRSASGMDHLIRDLLDVTHIEQGTLAIHRQSAPVAPVIEEAVTVVTPLAHAACLAIDVDVPAQLPAISADRARIVQVLSNLLGNAIKFTPPDGRIRVAARDTGACVELTVEDNG